MRDRQKLLFCLFVLIFSAILSSRLPPFTFAFSLFLTKRHTRTRYMENKTKVDGTEPNDEMYAHMLLASKCDTFISCHIKKGNFFLSSPSESHTCTKEQ